MTKTAPPLPAKVVAVLTGDVIGSTKLPAERLSRARDLVVEAARRFRLRRPRTLYGTPEFFRGDAWQLLVQDPGEALRAALLIRAMLFAELEVTTRISIGVGGVDVINRTHISLSRGEAFTLSGRALDTMTGYFDLTGALPERAGLLLRWFPAALHLCSGLIRPWTRRQAEIVGLALLQERATHAEIAKALRPRVTKQTVTESLAGAGWRNVLEAIRACEATPWGSVLGSGGAVTGPGRNIPRSAAKQGN